MNRITRLFWDVGGVILSNGWDQLCRRQAAQRFNLEWDDFRDRHEQAVPALETGQMKLEEYLQRTIFYRPRSFTLEEFKTFMFAQSQAHPETLAIVKGLAHSRHYLMATLNNESLELNLYRIKKFNLRDFFTVFLSSCFLGVRKPDDAIYRLALQITQSAPEECLFIDDRAPNLEGARHLGMHTIQYQNPAQLEADLHSFGVET